MNETPIQNNDVPDFEVETMARCLYPALLAFYDSDEGKAAFEKWKREHPNEL